MLNYIIRRLLGAIPTLFIIIAVSFVLVRMAPGGPFDKERKVPAEVEARLIQQYHLDEPLPQQFLRYLGGLAQGDFGPSFKYKDFTVSELIWQGFPTSLALGLSAITLAMLIGVSLGIWSALRQNSWVDYMSVGTAMLGIAVPNFVIAPIMTLVFGLMLGWLPVGGWGSPSNWILPIIALANAHDQVVRNDGGGALRGLLNAELTPYLAQSVRLELEGNDRAHGYSFQPMSEMRSAPMAPDLRALR